LFSLSEMPDFCSINWLSRENSCGLRSTVMDFPLSRP
jgi:hypothetical protein